MEAQRANGNLTLMLLLVGTWLCRVHSSHPSHIKESPDLFSAAPIEYVYIQNIEYIIEYDLYRIWTYSHVFVW